MGEIIPINVAPKKHSKEALEKILDSLYSIRLFLVSKKIEGKERILKTEFKTVVETEKQKSTDDEVIIAIDAALEDVFKKEKNEAVVEDELLSLDEMIQFAENNINKAQKDKVLTKALPQMRDNSSMDVEAA